MNAVILVAVTAGGITIAALAAWARIRALNERIRHLEAECAAWRYRTHVYGNTLTTIAVMQCPPKTLADARRDARQALDGVGYLEATG